MVVVGNNQPASSEPRPAQGCGACGWITAIVCILVIALIVVIVIVAEKGDDYNDWGDGNFRRLGTGWCLAAGG